MSHLLPLALANHSRASNSSRFVRLCVIGIACGLTGLAAAPASAQKGKLEFAYVVVGGQGAVARAILSDTAECPAITFGRAASRMRIRARPDTGANAAFPVLVCEALIPADAASASIEERVLPLPKARLGTVAVFGDTGCRLKDAKKPANRNESDHPEAGQFQDCDRQSKWPFSRLSASIAASKPDVVVHVGDYLYRESPCPKGNAGCAGSPYGDNWRTWQADFFAPAVALLTAAPWIMTRGNHEICERAGAGYFRFLDPRPAPGDLTPACTDLSPPYTANVAGRSFIVMDSSNAPDTCANDACDSGPYAAQFASLKPAPGSLFVSHRPIWGVGSKFTLNRTLQQALAAWKGKLPDGIELAVAGHMHIFEILSFDDDRSPQLIVGTGGTALELKIPGRLTGMTVGGATVRYGRAELVWGYTMLTPQPDGSGWTVTFTTIAGKTNLACTIRQKRMTCGRPSAAIR